MGISTAKLRSASEEIAQNTRSSAKESTEALRDAASKITPVVEAQSIKCATMESPERTRWLELEKFQGAKLQLLEDAALKVRASAEAAAVESRKRFEDERTKAEVNEKHGHGSIDALVRNCSWALHQQVSQWREGLGKQPFSAFTTDKASAKGKSLHVHEDASSTELQATIQAAMHGVVQALPSKEVLSAEFEEKRHHSGDGCPKLERPLVRSKASRQVNVMPAAGGNRCRTFHEIQREASPRFN